MFDQEKEYLRSPVLGTMLKSLLIGFLLAEIFPIVTTLLSAVSTQRYNVVWADAALAAVFLLAAAEAIVSVLRYGLKSIGRIAKSKRFDLLFAVLLGVFIAESFPPIAFERYSSLIYSLSIEQLVVLIATPFLLAGIWLAGALLSGHPRSNNTAPTVFVSDSEKVDQADDLLNVKDA